MKKILLLNANPKLSSFAKLLTDSYEVEAREKAEVRRMNLSEMEFNLSLDTGYDSDQPLEPSLDAFQQAITWADHIVVISPIWWGGIPAKFKGLLDRSILPGFAFKYEKGSAEPAQLLTGKTVRLILTMDAPEEYLEYQAKPVLDQLDLFTFQFSGMSPAKVTLFGSIIGSDEAQRQQWLTEVAELGASESVK
ncbi:NAD(P)H-dependent oxidoreductase [Vibrio penaeicida]|uniref:NAD(P)H-dependent oxidoreductase n=1 Tax=Vibrio penaeicida TaxID=104609 RepID=UPI002734668C|nr:NAD(P)H-dependent oxidoreductase [Vibrio penaeicida]MDP2572602.1 NAD(P)H-dependent oxidoreductase [Vibrio penaeicida]